MKKRVFIVVGTRPEVIKMAPVYEALRQVPNIETTLVSTGQHRELLDQAMAAFGLKPDIDLRVMKAKQSLTELTCSILEGMARVFASEASEGLGAPDLVLSHGDTTTCFGAALSCFYHRIPLAHVEAGLRSHCLDSPFPEEFNRQSVARLAELHFAPTEAAERNLLAEGVDPSRIRVTGTTAIDAVRRVRRMARVVPSARPSASPISSPSALATITLHRRENGGDRLRELLLGIRDAAASNPDTTFVYPVHPNPSVCHAAREILGAVPNVRLTKPLAYGEFIGLIARSRIVITDSGGIQEEAAFLGKRVLVLRDRTEREDGLAAGRVSIIGTERGRISAELSAALRESADDGEADAEMGDEAAPSFSPSERIARELSRRLE
jgi:UDP-N-acetylglucosamine 2-epimerase (non-hydrolysing)